MISRLSCATALSLLAVPALAQGWITDRTNNAIVNVDQITSRYRDQIAVELSRVGRRPAPPAGAHRRGTARGADRRSLVGGAHGPADGEPGTPIRVSLGFLYDSALINSAQIRVFGDLPAIRDTLAQEVAGRYVPRGYAEGRAEEINDPTRNLANTRGNQRLVQREQALEFGVRQRTITGGEYTIGQRFLNVSTNSTDYAPGQQCRARTFLTVVQPLLRDSGAAYTRSLHEVARLDANVAQMEFRRQAESHLLESRAPTGRCYLARAANAAEGTRARRNIRGIVASVEGRSGLDADPLLISRATSALALREADLLRARAAIRNAEARLRGLVNDPRFEQQGVGDTACRPTCRSSPTSRSSCRPCSNVPSRCGRRCSSCSCSTAPPCCAKARRRSRHCPGSTSRSKAITAAAA